MTGDCEMQHDFGVPTQRETGTDGFAQQLHACESNAASTLQPIQPGQIPLGRMPPASAIASRQVETKDFMWGMIPC